MPKKLLPADLLSSTYAGPPTPEQAAKAARAFTERARAANRARLENTLTQVDAQAGAELREYLADVEPTVPVSELRALLTQWDASYASNERVHVGLHSVAIPNLKSLIAKYERSR